MSHPSSTALSATDLDRLKALLKTDPRVPIATVAAKADVSVSTVQRLLRGGAANRATTNAVALAVGKLWRASKRAGEPSEGESGEVTPGETPG